MPYNAKILLDSVSPLGHRLTTFEVSYPRIVHSEILTHRKFSRNTASSRAIPFTKRLAQVLEDPFIPEYWGKNQKGMQADFEVVETDKKLAEAEWKNALDNAVSSAKILNDLGIHKQLANRLIEPFSFITAIISATDFDNFFKLRSSRWNKDAQPELRKIADMMLELYESNQPKRLKFGEFHLPLIQEDELSLDMVDLIQISVARTARVSYLTHNGIRDIVADKALYNRLVSNRHESPLEHVAMAFSGDMYFGNFKGWLQHRKVIEAINKSK